MSLLVRAARRCGRFLGIGAAVVAIGAAADFRAVLGGAGQDYAAAVASDAAGNTYVAGLAYSPDFPVTPGAVQTTFGGTSDAFIAKLGSDGKVIWSTYLGGILDDGATGIAVDAGGNVIVSGWTRSQNFPLVKAIRTTLNGGASATDFDAFVAKIDPTGTKLIYSTFLGGPDHDYGLALALDAAGNAYVTGTAQEAAGFTGLTSTASGYGSFVTKLDPGGALVYSFFHARGGGAAIALDAAANAYVTGRALASGPAGGTEPVLVYKVAADGSKQLFETTFGGSGNSDGTAIALDRTGAIYVGGTTAALDFPLVNPIESSFNSRTIWKTTDGGLSWTPMENLPFTSPQTVVVDPSAPNTLYAATTDAGMVKSTDGGVTWSKINRGISGSGLKALAIDPQHPQTLYAGSTSHGSVFKTTDGGANWSSIDSSAEGVFQVLVDAQNPSNVYAVRGTAARKSTDGGVTWSNIQFPGVGINYLALDPGASGNIYAYSPFIFGGFFGKSTNPYIWHSTDGGATWAMIPGPPVPALVPPGMLFDATVKPSLVYNALSYQSRDNGATWTPLPASPLSSAGPTAIDAAGTLYGVVYGNGLYTSHDRGQTWTQLGLPTADAATTGITAIIPTPEPSVLYAIVPDSQTSGFLTKLSPNGGSIVFSTLLNGHASFVQSPLYLAEPGQVYGQNQVSAIALDAAGNVIVAGETRAVDFPIANAVQPKKAGHADAFVTAMAGDGSKILYSTYLGGSQDEGALGLTTDAQGNAVVAGQTWSFDFPGGVQPPAGQLGDAFVAKIVPPGPPVITAVLNGASNQAGIEAGSWVAIKGTNLANTNPGRIWKDEEVVNGKLPTLLDGVSVTINGKPAFVYYISPTQINVQAPSDTATGAVDVVVNNNGTISAPVKAQLQAVAPAFFTYLGTNGAIASRLPDYAPVGGPNGTKTAPAKAGDTIVLWGTGFGATIPAVEAGSAVSGAPIVANTPVVTVGGMEPRVISAVLTTGTAGLYQITVQLPAGLPSGALEVQATVGGVKSPSGVTLVVQ